MSYDTDFTDSPMYKNRHARVRYHRGPAKTYLCEACPEQAHDWATIHGRDGESPDDYMALCRSCHRIYDELGGRPIGHAVSPETRRKISVALTGRVFSPETLDRMRAAQRPGPVNCKLTDDMVQEVKSRAAAGETKRALAREFNVDPKTIRDAVSGKTYKHVSERINLT